MRCFLLEVPDGSARAKPQRNRRRSADAPRPPKAERAVRKHERPLFQDSAKADIEGGPPHRVEVGTQGRPREKSATQPHHEWLSIVARDRWPKRVGQTREGLARVAHLRLGWRGQCERGRARA